MPKNPALQNLLDAVSATSGLKPENKHAGNCVKCGLEAAPRCKTELDRKEFEISGFCGVCWEEIFPPGKEED